MRKFLTTLFAASAMTMPAFAADVRPSGPTDHNRPRGGEARSHDNDDNGGGRERHRDGMRAESASHPRDEVQRPDRQQTSRPSAGPAEWSRHGMSDPAPRPRGPADQPTRETTWSHRDRPTSGTDSVRHREGDWTDRARTPRDPVVEAGRDRPAGAFGSRVGRHDTTTQWARNWRENRRYDWRSYRDHNRTVFRVGIYSDPYGYDYRRWNIGWSMRPSYYRSSFWISDPWRYRLPEVYGPFRWVRYYDDAVLVNTWTGEVVDVIYNFFW